MKRALIVEYQFLIKRLLPAVEACRLDAILAAANVPEAIRWFGQLTEANVTEARKIWANALLR